MVNISAKQFVKAWVDSTNEGSGYAGVSKKTGLEKIQIMGQSNKLKKRGVKLPRMQWTSVSQIDTEALNDYIAQNTKH